MVIFTDIYRIKLEKKIRKLESENKVLKDRLKNMWNIIENKKGMLKAIRKVDDRMKFHKEEGDK